MDIKTGIESYLHCHGNIYDFLKNRCYIGEKRKKGMSADSS